MCIRDRAYTLGEDLQFVLAYLALLGRCQPDFSYLVLESALTFYDCSRTGTLSTKYLSLIHILLRPVIDWMFPYQTWCKQLIRRLGLADHVQYTGPLDAAAMRQAYLDARCV